MIKRYIKLYLESINNQHNENTMRKGAKLQNSTPRLAIVSVSAPEAIWNPMLYKTGCQSLADRGIQVIEGPTIHKTHFSLSGTPQEIADGLLEVFRRDDVDAIMCAGGGTVMNTVLPFINFASLRESMKPFIGSSNIIALMVAMLNEGMVTFHGPCCIWSYGLPKTPTDYTHDNWLQILQGYTGELPKITEWKTFRPGEATGQLIGGNLWTLGTIICTDYCPISLFEKKILIVEEIDEDYARLEAQLIHMKALGAFNKLSGIVFGKMVECESPENVTMSFEDLLENVFGEYNFPILYECDFGHVPDNLCLPFGCEVQMIADNNPKLVLNEAGVMA